MWEYKPDDKFHVRELSTQDEASKLEHSLFAARWGLLATAAFIFTIVLAVKGRWIYAILIYIMSNICGAISVYYKRQGEQVGHE